MEILSRKRSQKPAMLLLLGRQRCGKTKGKCLLPNTGSRESSPFVAGRLSPSVEEREPLATLATTGPDGTPNVIWVLCMNLTDEAQLVVADNAMDKTRTNIDAGSPGALVFLAQPRRAYQLKGPLSYHADGPVFEAMKHGWLDDSYPGAWRSSDGDQGNLRRR